jgi:hypothetical protein
MNSQQTQPSSYSHEPETPYFYQAIAVTASLGK